MNKDVTRSRDGGKRGQRKKVLKSPVCYPVSRTTLKEQSCDYKLCPPAWQCCVAPCDPTDCHCCRTIAGDSLCLWKTNWYPEIWFVFQCQAPHQLSHTEECTMLASLIVITVLFILAISFMARTILYLFSFPFFSFWLLLTAFSSAIFVPVEEQTGNAQGYQYSTGIYAALLENKYFHMIPWFSSSMSYWHMKWQTHALTVYGMWRIFS